MTLDEVEQIERAKLLVLQADEAIATQQGLIADLRRLGIGTADAEANLRSLMAEQELRKDHLTLLEETAWHLVAA